jgi:hypothetical protein
MIWEEELNLLTTRLAEEAERVEGLVAVLSDLRMSDTRD